MNAVRRIALLTGALVFVPCHLAAAEEHGTHGEAATAAHAGGEHAEAEASMQAGGEHGEAAHESEHGEGHSGPLHFKDVITDTQFIGSVVNFAVLLGILYFLGRKPLAEFLVTRRKEVADGLAEAAKAKAEAEAKYKEYSERLEKLDEEIKRMTDAIAAAAQNDKQRIVEEAEARAQRLKQDTQRLIEQQMKQLYMDVMQEVVDSSIETAESVLREKLNAQDQQKLAQDYVAALGKSAKPEKRA